LFQEIVVKIVLFCVSMITLILQ